MTGTHRIAAAALAVALGLAGCSHNTTPADGTSTAESSAAESAPSAPPVSEARTKLLKMVPAGYPPGSCTPGPALGGAVAAVSCGRNQDSGGPPAATYTLFADAGTLQLSFDNTVQSSTVTVCPGRIQSPGAWHHTATPDKPAGMLLCGSRQDHPMLAWTNDGELLLSVAQSEHGGPSLEQLYSWWSSHS